jgi:hypothetical protein
MCSNNKVNSGFLCFMKCLNESRSIRAAADGYNIYSTYNFYNGDSNVGYIFNSTCAGWRGHHLPHPRMMKQTLHLCTYLNINIQPHKRVQLCRLRFHISLEYAMHLKLLLFSFHREIIFINQLKSSKFFNMLVITLLISTRMFLVWKLF